MLKFYDVLNFDMTNMIDLGFTPSCCCWATRPGAVDPRVAVADAATGALHVWSASGSSSTAEAQAQSRTVYTGIHGNAHPVTCMALHPTSGAIVSADARGIVEYWLPTQGGAFPKSATKFTSKFTTDLFKLARKKIRPRAVAMAPNGNYFALSCGDGKVRLYHFRTGKLRRVFEEVTEEQAAAIAEDRKEHRRETMRMSPRSAGKPWRRTQNGRWKHLSCRPATAVLCKPCV